MPCSWHHVLSPQEMGFYVCASSNALPHERKSCLGVFSIFAYSHHRFHHREACQGQDEIAFVVHDATFSLSHLSLATWPVHYPTSGIRDCPHENGFYQFEWCLRSPLDTFRSFYFDHAQDLGSCLVVGIQPTQADGSLLYEGLILPCSIVVLTCTRVLPTDDANCRVRV